MIFQQWKTIKLPPSDDNVPASGMFNPEFRTVGGVGVFDASTGRSSDRDDCERVSKPSIGFTGFISISSFDWESFCGRPVCTNKIAWIKIAYNGSIIIIKLMINFQVWDLILKLALWSIYKFLIEWHWAPICKQEIY